MRSALSLALLAAICLTGAAAHAEGQPVKMLFLSKSAGFEHDAIKQENGQPSVADTILTEVCKGLGIELVCTKDASLINAENLKNYKAVIFYTTGYLTEAGSDGHPPMGENGLKELLDWINAGGGFFGLHSATDSFHSKGDEVSPYIEMIGGEFETHGQQFKGALRVVSPGHPAIASLPDGWEAFEEWYINKNLNTAKMHVLALLEVGDKTRERQPKLYNIPDYPIVWCRAYGQGRVLYNGLGHNKAVWEADVFKKLVADNLKWVAGQGELKADPNYDQVVPKTIGKK